MSLISVVIVLIIVGVALYVINSLIPMEANIKKILNIVVIIVVLIWLLGAFGVWTGGRIGPPLNLRAVK